MVRRTYRFLLLALAVVTVLVDVLGSYAVVHWTSAAPQASGWVQAGLLIARILGVVAVIFAAPLVAINTCNVLFPIFSEIPFFAGFRSMHSERAERLRQKPGFGNLVAIANSLRRFFTFVLLSLVCFVVGLIPFVGPVLGPSLQLYFAARTLGWEMLDPYFDRLEIPWAEQKLVVRRYSAEVLGMGLVCAPLLAIPFVGPLFFGLLQAAAPRFVIDLLPTGDSRRDLVGSET